MSDSTTSTAERCATVEKPTCPSSAQSSLDVPSFSGEERQIEQVSSTASFEEHKPRNDIDESTTTLAGGVLATKEPTLPPLLQVQYPPSVHDREARGLAPTALSTTIESQIPQYKNNNMADSTTSSAEVDLSTEIPRHPSPVHSSDTVSSAFIKRHKLQDEDHDTFTGERTSPPHSHFSPDVVSKQSIGGRKQRSRTDITNRGAARTSPGSSIRSIHRQSMARLQPNRRSAGQPTIAQSLRLILRASWLNILLIFVPALWVIHFKFESIPSRDTIIFILSFLTIIPLHNLDAFVLDDLLLRLHDIPAGLLNATLGNAVELIVAIIALAKCDLDILRASLVGSILRNLLLVLGMCFFAGGLKHPEQSFGIGATQLNISLLAISVIAVLLPAVFHFSVAARLTDQEEGHDILSISRGVAIILLFVYVAHLGFQLYTHPHLYKDESNPPTQTVTCNNLLPKLDHDDPQNLHLRRTSTKESQLSESSTYLETDETPLLNLWLSIGLLIAITALVAVTAEWLVDSIGGMTRGGHITKEFVGIIILPLVGNVFEHATAVIVSKDKLNLSLGLAVGSSLQITLFIVPLIVILGWILGKPLPSFDPYESAVLFLSVLTVNYVIQDGKSNWLKGFILISLYVILTVTFWFYPALDPSGLVSQCRV